MQAMKILAVVVVAMVVTMGSANKCNRNWRKTWDAQQKEQMKSDCDCHEPRPTFVTITPPQEYATIHPNVVKVPRCTGQCMASGRTCMATKSKTLKIAVEARTYGNHMQMVKSCLRMPVVVDEECACACDESRCTGNKTCRMTDCMCKCDDTQEQECNERVARGELVMWDMPSCSCPCNQGDTVCSHGEEFDMTECRCT